MFSKWLMKNFNGFDNEFAKIYAKFDADMLLSCDIPHRQTKT
jgi:hypothetical protein